MAKNKEKDNKPEHKIRVGGVTATIWKNTIKGRDNKDVDVFNTTIERSYLDKDNEWQTSNSFNANDLHKVIVAARKAFEFIAVKEQDEEEE